MSARPITENKNLERQAVSRQKRVNDGIAAIPERDELCAQLYDLGYTHKRIAEVLSEAGEPVKRSMVQKALERRNS